MNESSSYSDTGPEGPELEGEEEDREFKAAYTGSSHLHSVLSPLRKRGTARSQAARQHTLVSMAFFMEERGFSLQLHG